MENKPGPRISLERTIKIFDDDHGWHVAVGDDADGLGLCRITLRETGTVQEIVLPWHHARALAVAVTELADKQA